MKKNLVNVTYKEISNEKNDNWSNKINRYPKRVQKQIKKYEEEKNEIEVEVECTKKFKKINNINVVWN